MPADPDDLKIPQDLLFTREHVWVRPEGTKARIGVTEFFLDNIGQVMNVDIAEKGSEVDSTTELAVITGSTSGVLEVYAPLEGKVVSVNAALLEDPDLVLNDPYDEGWLCVLSGVDEDEIDNLLTPEDYQDDVADL